MLRFLILACLASTLFGCYESDTRVILPSEGVRLDNFRDGDYRVQAGKRIFRARLRWNQAEHGFDVEELNRSGNPDRRGLLRIMPIEPPYYVAERENRRGQTTSYDLTFVSVTDDGLRRFDPADPTVERDLARKNDVQLRRSGGRTHISGSLHALRDFLADVADSDTLKETSDGYRFLGKK